MKSNVIGTLVFILSIGVGLAHEGLGHEKDSVKTERDSSKVAEDIADSKHDTSQEHAGEMKMGESKVTAALSDFPSLHPMIVHFAIVLIIVAAGLQLVNLWLKKMEIGWITTAILFGGVVTALLAAKLFHPHTHGLGAHAQLVLDQHDLWADWTINTAIFALVLQLSGYFLFKGKKWISFLVAVVLVASAYSVSRAGHYGSQLVHLEGVGPQGKFLEMEH
ncbi:MAG: hypothetical protein K8H85_15210 [Cyclobacteriaceae bacterium]|nr:hypothetical protein [Cyclobacteriaceae bacterium]